MDFASQYGSTSNSGEPAAGPRGHGFRDSSVASKGKEMAERFLFPWTSGLHLAIPWNTIKALGSQLFNR
jgi:hypothetical protein